MQAGTLRNSEYCLRDSKEFLRVQTVVPSITPQVSL